MEKQCPVAQFVRRQIQIVGKTQKEISEEVGFESPNVISMIKQGRTKLSLGKVGKMAHALETDPMHLLKLCLSTYHQETWKSIEPLLETALTEDEKRLVNAWRAYAGMPYVAALSTESQELLKKFLASLRTASTIRH